MVAGAGTMRGVPGFFRPRAPCAFSPSAPHPPESLYDTTLLRATLARLVDFDFSTLMVRASAWARWTSRELVVKFEFIRKPDSTGIGNYTESGQVIPVTLDGAAGGYTHAMYLDDGAPIAGGREIWDFPKKLAAPALRVEAEAPRGTLDMGSVRIATGTMGYSHPAWAHLIGHARLAGIRHSTHINNLREMRSLRSAPDEDVLK